MTVRVPRIPFTVLPERHTPTSVLNPAEKERNHISAEQQSGLFDGRKRDWKGQEPDSFLLQGKANSALSKGMQGTTKEKKRESVNRSAQFHRTAYTGHVREGLTRIIIGFNGANLREPKWLDHGGRQTNKEQRWTDRQTVKRVRISSSQLLSLKSPSRKYVEK